MVTKFSELSEQQMRDLLIGRRIVAIDADSFTLDNGTVLRIDPNSGCGGCNSGWYEITRLSAFDHVITRVDLEDDATQDPNDHTAEEPHTYSIFVYSGKKTPRHQILAVSGDDGNGYYGTGYEIHVTEGTAL